MFNEIYIDERVERAKKRARGLIEGNPETPSDVIYLLRSVLCEYYKKPLFDPYFEERTLDELIFEIELVVNRNKADNVARGSELLKNNPKEAEELFADWDKLDEEGSVIDDNFLKAAENFMNTGSVEKPK